MAIQLRPCKGGFCVGCEKTAADDAIQKRNKQIDLMCCVLPFKDRLKKACAAAKGSGAGR
jgi:hypothetical protein